MNSYIVVLGDPVDGFTYYGPFADYDDAMEYAQTECGECSWWIAPLTPTV